MKKYWIYIIITAFISSALADDKETLLNTFSAGYSKDTFNLGYQDWDSSFISLGRKFAFGPVTARLNQTERFQDRAQQFEIEGYPVLRDGTYMYLNMGYSNNSLYPRQRYGAEIYQSFLESWESSVGYRLLNYNNKNEIYTASLGKYMGTYYTLLRLSSVPDGSGRSGSVNLQIRKYISDENYVSVQMGSGQSLSQIDTTSDVVSLSTQQISIDARFEVKPTWILYVGAGQEKEEIKDSLFRNRTNYSIGFDKRY